MKSKQAFAQQEFQRFVICSGVILALALVFLAKAIFAPAGQVLAGPDIRAAFYPWLTQSKQALQVGHLPLWDSSVFSGYPFIANPQVSLFYPLSWLMFILPIERGFTWQLVLHLWIAGTGMLIFVYMLSRSWEGALLAALSFTFSGFISVRIWAGHVTLIGANAWIPWSVAGLLWSIRQEKIGYAILAGLPLAFVFLAGHPTSLLYIGIIWAAFVIYLMITDERHLLVLRQAAIAGITACVLAGIQLIPTLHLLTFSTRAALPWEQALYGSMKPVQVVTLIIPEFLGTPLSMDYRGTFQFEELIYYAGMLPLVSLLLVLKKRSKIFWLYSALLVLGIWLALGLYGYLYPLLYYNVFFFRFGRIPARAGLLFTFSITALLGHAIGLWRQEGNSNVLDTLAQTLRKTFNLSAAGGLMAIATTVIFFTLFAPPELDQLWLMRILSDWVRALGLLLVGLLLLRHYLTIQQPSSQRRRLIFYGLVLLVIVDLWSFGYRLIQLTPAQPDRNIWVELEAAGIAPGSRIMVQETILDDYGNWAVYSDYQHAYGYNPVRVANYDALYTASADPRSGVFDVLSISHVVDFEPLDDYTGGANGLVAAGRADSLWVYERPTALPEARLVYTTEVIEDTEVALKRLQDSDFEPGATVILDQATDCNLPRSEERGTATVDRHTNMEWIITTDSANAAVLVVSEIMYPGWAVTIDGKAAEPLTAYTALKAVCVPAGMHTVRWHYNPVDIKIGVALTLIGLIAIGLAMIGIFKGK